jgi:hypothetical protein
MDHAFAATAAKSYTSKRMAEAAMDSLNPSTEPGFDIGIGL